MPGGRRRRALPLDIKEPGDEGVSVYRIVKLDDPTDPAFVKGLRSRAARGEPPRPGTREETTPFVHEGISAFATREDAGDHAAEFRQAGINLGDYIAEFRLTAGKGIRYAEWGKPGHLTVVADPLILRDAVVDIVRVN